MNSPGRFFVLPLLSALAFAIDCRGQESVAEDSIEVGDFEANALPESFRPFGVTAKIVGGLGVTSGDHALRLDLPADSGEVGVRIAPEEPWNCERLGPCRLSLDATNVGTSSIHLRCDVSTPWGATARRSIAVPVGETLTVYFPLTTVSAYEDLGMRDDPSSLDGCGQKMLLSNPKRKIDLSRVKSIRLYVNDTAQNDSVVFDNLRIVSDPPPNEDFLTAIIDEFGQAAGPDFAQKARDEADLRRRADAEVAALRSGSAVADRGRYGGWAAGPRLEATGYFRTEKVGDRWALVDPEGYLYFASGIDNLRMANTSTFTGVDFRDDSVRYRDPEDVTPEDSVGIIPSSSSARATAYDAYPQRRGMFQWLPPYDHPLAKHYGYRRSAHSGPFPHGEVFSFYRANLERRYGPGTTDEVMAVWRGVTLDRMRDWGFTCLGNWTDAAFYPNQKVPFFANGWIIGDFKTVSSGADYWGPMPDPFDPEFARRAEVTVRVVADEVRATPWCVGVFIDNEKAWGNETSLKSRYGIVIHTLPRDAADCPTKAAWVRLLREKYVTAEALGKAWQAEIGSWDEFAAGFPKQESYDVPEQLTDFSTLLEAYADKYFKTVHDALEKHLPNHLYLGCRMTPWGMTTETRRAAARYADVMSYNYYREALGARNWGFLESIDKPSIIGEFHMGSTDSGIPNPGLIAAADQEDRALMYKAYMESVIDNPYFVGAHWFQYIDSPLTGRAHDGENYNVGFVTVADIPYEPMVRAAKEINGSLYPRRFGAVKAAAK